MGRFLIVTLVLAMSACSDDSKDRAKPPAAEPPEEVETVQIPVPPDEIPQFVQALPRLRTVSGNAPLTLRMCEFPARILPPGSFGADQAPDTWVWGYIANDACPTDAQDTYVGPVVVATRGVPTEVRFENNLGTAATSNLLFYRRSLDQTLDWADPLNFEANVCDKEGTIPEPGSICALNYAGPIATVGHLHGGEVPPQLDGGPFSWFTNDGAYRGSSYYTAPFTTTAGNQAVYRYPNSQEAAPLWIHDHAMGVTRLNVYAGLAGAWLLEDPEMNLPANLPGADELIPLVLQDRQFDTNGQLFYQADSWGGEQWAPNPQHPYWAPEMIGDVVVVNGKAWPYLEVEPRRYRFLFLNGSQARTFALSLEDAATGNPGPAFYVISTDGGYLDAPARIDAQDGQDGQGERRLTLMPGERYQLLVDFGGLEPGTRLVMRNTARNPFPMGDAPDPDGDGRVIQFRVTCPQAGCPVTDSTFDPSTGAPLRTGQQVIRRLVDPATGTLAAGVTASVTLQLTLNEVLSEPSTAINPITGELTEYPGGPRDVLLNNTELRAERTRPQGDFVPVSIGNLSIAYSELPHEGATEVWEFVNLTADAHPIHLHLTQFQLMNRQRFDRARYERVYAAAFSAVTGRPDCPGGVYCPEFGPPLDYHTGNPRAYGGNPDIVPYLDAPAMPPRPWEAGWKDTVIMPPGMVTRIAVRWAPIHLPVDSPKADLFFPFDPMAGVGYVWHCHILDHEDNEMMRPYRVSLNPDAPAPPLRPYVQGEDY